MLPPNEFVPSLQKTFSLFWLSDFGIADEELKVRKYKGSYLSEIVLLGFRVTGTWMQEDRHKDILVEQEATALVTP